MAKAYSVQVVLKLELGFLELTWLPHGGKKDNFSCVDNNCPQNEKIV